MRIVCSLNNPDESELLRGKKHLLDRLDVKCTYSFLCDNCRCDKKHEAFTTRCALCLYSVVGFGRNYFALAETILFVVVATLQKNCFVGIVALLELT